MIARFVDGKLVCVAQPNGRPPTECVLAESSWAAGPSASSTKAKATEGTQLSQANMAGDGGVSSSDGAIRGAAEGYRMSEVTIPTASLDLVLKTPAEVLAWVQSLPPEVRAEVSPDWLARVRTTPAGDPWLLQFTIIERATGLAVGGCGFKGPPDAEGMVELAYGIDPPHQCRGFATEATRGLVGFASANELVRVVRAHTRPGNGPSQRVLTKCGFRQVGEVIDPEDGLVIRWEQPRAEIDTVKRLV